MAACSVPNVAASTATSPHLRGPRRFAVLGAGFAGVSVAWHLLQHTRPGAPVCVELFDEAGIGGELPVPPAGFCTLTILKMSDRLSLFLSGKLLWKGAEGWNAALKLLAVAEMASSVSDENTGTKPLAWRRGILRLAKQPKHSLDFKKAVQNINSTSVGQLRLECVSGPEAEQLIPGLSVPEGGLALHIPQAINVHPQRYLKALWSACKSFAEKASALDSPDTRAILRKERISSLRELKGSFEAVVVCLGAQALMLPELVGKLPLVTCRGVVAQLHVPIGSRASYAAEAPNMLFGTWVAVQGVRDLLLGATKDWGSVNASPSVSSDEALASQDKLVSDIRCFYPSIQDWEIKGWQAGLRAMPPRTSLGSVPLAGSIDDLVQSSHGESFLEPTKKPGIKSSTKWWLFSGLGSRGLIHHGWLGEEVAKAVVHHNESLLLPVLRQW